MSLLLKEPKPNMKSNLLDFLILERNLFWPGNDFHPSAMCHGCHRKWAPYNSQPKHLYPRSKKQRNKQANRKNIHKCNCFKSNLLNFLNLERNLFWPGNDFHPSATCHGCHRKWAPFNSQPSASVGRKLKCQWSFNLCPDTYTSIDKNSFKPTGAASWLPGCLAATCYMTGWPVFRQHALC